MLSRLVIKNFKSIGEDGVDLELRPLTFLVGPNGSGKSSVLEALALIAQSLEPGKSGGAEPLPLLPGILESRIAQPLGKLVNFSSLTDVSHRHTAETSIEITIKLDELPLIPIIISPKDDTLSIRLPPPPPSPAGIISAADMEQSVDTLASRTQFLAAKVRADYWDKQEGYDMLAHLNKVWSSGLHQRLRETITGWAAKFGIANLWVEQPSRVIDYEDLGVRLDIKSSSLGSSQVFPIIVQTAVAEPGSIILIEEPEISLHPEAQVVMAELLATAASESKQIIATTHSTFLLLGLRKAVTKGVIKAESIAVYEVTKGPKGSTAKRLPLREEGYIEGWVPSFGEVEKNLLQGWLEIIPKAE